VKKVHLAEAEIVDSKTIGRSTWLLVEVTNPGTTVKRMLSRQPWVVLDHKGVPIQLSINKWETGPPAERTLVKEYVLKNGDRKSFVSEPQKLLPNPTLWVWTEINPRRKIGELKYQGVYLDYHGTVEVLPMKESKDVTNHERRKKRESASASANGAGSGSRSARRERSRSPDRDRDQWL
jgi:hypothetical protein